MEIKKLTPQQKKAAWIVGAVLFTIHFLPSFIATMQQEFSHSTRNVVTPPRPQAAAPPPIAVTPAPVAPDPFAPQYIGVFQGQLLTPEMTNCTTSLEVRPAIAKPGFYSGYESTSCSPSALFYKGALTAEKKGELPFLIRAASPVSASMTCSITDGDMAFRIDQVVGATPPERCGPSKYAISAFGTGQVMAQWEEAYPCKPVAGHMVLVRKRA